MPRTLDDELLVAVRFRSTQLEVEMRDDKPDPGDILLSGKEIKKDNGIHAAADGDNDFVPVLDQAPPPAVLVKPSEKRP